MAKSERLSQLELEVLAAAKQIVSRKGAQAAPLPLDVELFKFCIRQHDMIKHLTSALDHALRFSSLPRRWPEQHRAFLDLILEGRVLSGMLPERILQQQRTSQTDH